MILGLEYTQDGQQGAVRITLTFILVRCSSRSSKYHHSFNYILVE